MNAPILEPGIPELAPDLDSVSELGGYVPGTDANQARPEARGAAQAVRAAVRSVYQAGANPRTVEVGLDPTAPPGMAWWARCKYQPGRAVERLIVDRCPSAAEALEHLGDSVRDRMRRRH